MCRCAIQRRSVSVQFWSPAFVPHPQPPPHQRQNPLPVALSSLTPQNGTTILWSWRVSKSHWSFSNKMMLEKSNYSFFIIIFIRVIASLVMLLFFSPFYLFAVQNVGCPLHCVTWGFRVNKALICKCFRIALAYSMPRVPRRQGVSPRVSEERGRTGWGLTADPPSGRRWGEDFLYLTCLGNSWL